MRNTDFDEDNYHGMDTQWGGCSGRATWKKAITPVLLLLPSKTETFFAYNEQHFGSVPVTLSYCFPGYNTPGYYEHILTVPSSLLWPNLTVVEIIRQVR